jgi:hypothetical protein
MDLEDALLAVAAPDMYSALDKGAVLLEKILLSCIFPYGAEEELNEVITLMNNALARARVENLEVQP